MQWHVGRQRGAQHDIDVGVAQAGQHVFAGKGADLDAQPGKRLRQFRAQRPQPTTAGADAGLLKQRIGCQHAVCKRPARVWG